MSRHYTWDDFVNNSKTDWKTQSLGNLFDHRQEKNKPDLPLLSVTGARGVVDRDSLERRDTSNPDKKKYLRVQRGDIVYNTMRMWQGVSGSAPKNGIVSPAYTVLATKKNIDSVFAKFLMKSDLLIQKFHQSSQGLVNDTLSLKFVNFSSIIVRIPTLPEQKKIAAILSSVDDVIENIQKQINKLQDLKKATMNELLTKGINHKEFKNSPLGKIPKSWEVKKLGELGEFKNGINKPKEAFGSGTKFVNISDAYPVNLDCRSLGRLQATAREVTDYSLEPGDLVFVRSSVKLGGVAIPTIFKGYEEPVIFCGFMIRYRIQNKQIFPDYLRKYLLTDASRILIQRVATGGANININQEALNVFNVLLPSLPEQKKISSILTSIDKNIETKTNKLNQTQSLKKSLMQNLLTGKVRVKI